MQLDRIANHITQWLKTYCNASSTKGFVIGISGGIDSALTSLLCARTDLPVLCLEMPIHQANSQVCRSELHIRDLKKEYANITAVSVPLTRTLETFLEALPEVSVDREKQLLSGANTRARLRMTTLYHFACLYGYLVAGTGNKIEDFGVGFFTKYGDGGVDISPIADLTKTEVYALAEHLGVCKTIIDAPPTDGLWGDDRSDEDQIGASYPELEWAMLMSEKGKTAHDFKGRQREVLTLYKKLNAVNRHKMDLIPVCEIPIDLKT